MSDNAVPEVKVERPVYEDAPQANQPLLGEEIKQFGRNLVAAFRSVAQSEEVHNLRTEIVDSFRDIGKDIQETFEQTKSKQEVKAVTEQARKVTESVSSSFNKNELGGDLQSGLTNALRMLNTELNKIIDQLQSKSARVETDVDSSAKEVKKEESGS